MDRIKRIEEDLQDCSVDNRSCVACRSILSILKILLILSNSWPGQRHWSGAYPIFILSGGAGRGAMQVCFENSPDSPLKTFLKDETSCFVLTSCAHQEPRRNGQD